MGFLQVNSPNVVGVSDAYYVYPDGYVGGSNGIVDWGSCGNIKLHLLH